MVAQQPILIPVQHWEAFKQVRIECSLWDKSYFMFIRHCLNDGDLRQLGEWATDFLPPHKWAAGIERGFMAAPEDECYADADTQTTTTSETEL